MSRLYFSHLSCPCPTRAVQQCPFGLLSAGPQSHLEPNHPVGDAGEAHGADHVNEGLGCHLGQEICRGIVPAGDSHTARCPLLVPASCNSCAALCWCQHHATAALPFVGASIMHQLRCCSRGMQQRGPAIRESYVSHGPKSCRQGKGTCLLVRQERLGTCCWAAPPQQPQQQQPQQPQQQLN